MIKQISTATLHEPFGLFKKRCEVGIVPITIHDSLVVEREHEQEALKIISNVFKQAYGVVPKFHEKAL